MSSDKELAHLKTTFLANGYPLPVINRNINHYRRSKSMNSNKENESKLLILPYIKGISEKIERICNPLNIKVNFQSSTTLRKLLVHVKQATPMEKKKGVVYSIPCMDCNSV